MAGYFRTDSGQTFKPGRINSTRSNTRLKQRPEAGRAPSFKQGPGSGATQQSTMPPKGGGWSPLKWLKGKTQAPVRQAPVKTKPPVPGKPIQPGGIEGSIAGAAVYAAGDALIPHISREAVRGALVVTGQDTTDYDLMTAGRPVVRNVGGKSFNIATPEGLRGYQKALASGEKPSVPAQPAEKPVKPRTGAGQNLPPSAATPGEGPEGNTVGSDADPETPGLQGPGAPKPGARVNANGLVSYGKDLSSLNAFTKEFTGGTELTDIKSAFQSEDLPTAYQTGSNTISTEQTPYELPEGAAPSPLNTALAGTKDLEISDTTYTVGEASVPGTVGRSGDAQEGSSSKPDIAEEVRTIRMRRKGPRDDGGPRGFAIDRANEMAQNSVSETKGNGMNAKRRAIRSAFLDLDTPIIKASVKANAIAGYGKDSNGNARFNYGGQLVNAKEGMEQKAKNAAMMGKNPTPYLEIPEATTPEQTPATLKLDDVDVTSDTFTQVQKEAQEFLKGKLTKTK